MTSPAAPVPWAAHREDHERVLLPLHARDLSAQQASHEQEDEQACMQRGNPQAGHEEEDMQT